MSTIIATTLSNGSVSVPTATVVNGSAKAWVNFNGTGTIAARDSFNVASLTDNGTGDYTTNFSNAFGAGDYSANISGGNGANLPMSSAHVSLTTSSFRFFTGGLTVAVSNTVDPTIVNATIHGDLA